MADPTRRHPRNAPGPWFVSLECISCDACTDISPEVFDRDENRKAFVRAWLPQDPEAERLFQFALESCPVEAVGEENASQK